MAGNLTALDVNPRILDAAKKGKLVSITDVLHLSAAEISRRAGVSDKDAWQLIEAASKAVFPRTSCSALDAIMKSPLSHDCYMSSDYLSTGCENIDKFLNNGLLSRGIIEIFGESATCKTLFCLQLAMTVQRARTRGGLEAGCAYICTESAFPVMRLDQLIQHHDPENARRLTDNIFIEHVDSVVDLSSIVNVRLPALLQRSHIRLIVIDSIAALFRLDFGLDEASARASSLFAMSARLKQLADEHHAVIVCTNQVASVDGRTIPALGMAWSGCVNTRLMLTRSAHANAGVESVNRRLHVIFSPYVAPGSIAIAVDDAGMSASGQP